MGDTQTAKTRIVMQATRRGYLLKARIIDAIQHWTIIPAMPPPVYVEILIRSGVKPLREERRE